MIKTLGERPVWLKRNRHGTPPSADLLALPLSSSVYSHAYPSPHHVCGRITGDGGGPVASGGRCAGGQSSSSPSGHIRSGGATGPQPSEPGRNIYVSAGGRWDGASHSSKDRSGRPRGRRSPGTAARVRSQAAGNR